MTRAGDTPATSSEGTATPGGSYDVVVVGAGFAGLYGLHHFRELGFSVTLLERGDGVGGTWYWNRYPGARCDTPSLEYSFGFSPELEQDWEWSEYFASQPEIERYLNHVADRFDLRRDIRFGRDVVSMTFDETSARWSVVVAGGESYDARFVVMATGCLSQPIEPDLPGLESFAGTVLRTSGWPDSVDLTGSRVALVGTGSSGVQAAPELAAVAEHLYLFQRTPAFTWPSQNGPMDPQVQASAKAQYQELRRRQRNLPNGVAGFGGAQMFPGPRPVQILDATEEELEAALDELGFGACRAWSDVLNDLEANELGVELYRRMIRRTVADPATADKLSPHYPLGCKRPILDTGYFDIFNRPNVTLVDIGREPIVEFSAAGIRTEQAEYEVDVVVLATGFDAMTGALTRVDIRGRGGRLLRDTWSAGPGTLFGLQVAGYPNLFTVTGPGSPSVVANMATGIEHHIEWIGSCMTYLRDHGRRTIEPTIEAQEAWGRKVFDAGKNTMYMAPTCNSWYLGANIPGKPRVFLPYVGGLDSYIRDCEEAAAADYEGFVVD